jgi:hypothetical protein
VFEAEVHIMVVEVVPVVIETPLTTNHPAVGKAQKLN